jgi:hypothetical protein
MNFVLGVEMEALEFSSETGWKPILLAIRRVAQCLEDFN